MERLTIINEHGNLTFNQDCYTGGGFVNIEKVKRHLAKLEDEIENGLMLKLPCKVGDTLYRICPQGAHIKYGEMWDGKIVAKPCQRCPWGGCRCFDIGYQKDMQEHIVQPREMKSFETIIQILPYFGTIWFKTKEEAEHRLSELKAGQQ